MCVGVCVGACTRACVCVESLEFSEMGGLPKLGGGSGVIFEMGFFLNTLQ